jgi:hypothetical protein
MMDDWFINIACTARHRSNNRTNSFHKSRSFSPAAASSIGHQGTAAHIPPDLILVRRALPGAFFICRHQGGSHAEWPKDSHEHAPTQTCGAVLCPPKAVDTECRPNPVERASKRPKKLRAISRACPRRSPVGECRRRGELPPTRRALLQIDVFEPRGDIDRDVPSRPIVHRAVLDAAPRPRRLVNRPAHALIPPLRWMKWPSGSKSGL